MFSGVREQESRIGEPLFAGEIKQNNKTQNRNCVIENNVFKYMYIYNVFKNIR